MAQFYFHEAESLDEKIVILLDGNSEEAQVELNR